MWCIKICFILNIFLFTLSRHSSRNSFLVLYSHNCCCWEHWNPPYSLHGKEVAALIYWVMFTRALSKWLEVLSTVCMSVCLHGGNQRGLTRTPKEVGCRLCLWHWSYSTSWRTFLMILILQLTPVWTFKDRFTWKCSAPYEILSNTVIESIDTLVCAMIRRHPQSSFTITQSWDQFLFARRRLRQFIAVKYGF